MSDWPGSEEEGKYTSVESHEYHMRFVVLTYQ